MHGGRRIGQLRDRRRPRGEDRRAVARQLFIPVGEFVRAGAAVLDAFEQGVALRDDSVVALERAEVLVIDLGEHDVEIAPAARGSAPDQLHVVGGEEHGGDRADDVGRAPRDAIELEAP